MRTLAECERRGLDIGPPLREFGREQRKEVAETIRAARGFPPHAASTIAFYQRQGGSDKKFTMRGDIRQAQVAKLEQEGKRLAGLKAWAAKKYGKRLPAGLQRKFDNYENKLKRLEAESQRRRGYSVYQQGQVGADRLVSGDLVEVRVVRDGNKKRARITSAGYNGAANVAFPRHLRQVGATYKVPASAIRQVSAGYYRVQPTKIMRTSAGPGGGAVPPLLGRVPQTLYYKVIRKGRHWLLIWGSRWKTDALHNRGDQHNPKREHVVLTGDAVNRLMQKLVSYGIEPLRGAA